MSKTHKIANLPKVFVADCERYDLPVTEFGMLCFDKNYFIRNPLDNFRLVVLTGGEDISPSIYGHKEAFECGWTSPDRDAKDTLIYQIAVSCGIPVVGICRGAQLVCILNNGSLYQHTTGHTVWHDMRTESGALMLVSSTHHQMMIPSGSGETIAWSDSRRSDTYIGHFLDNGVPSTGEIEAPETEPEVVFYPKTQSLAVQYHPEYMGRLTDAFRYFKQTLADKLQLESVPSATRSGFVSLPKPILTQVAIDTENAALARMTEQEKAVYMAKKYRDEFISSRVRYLRSLFYTEHQALSDAIAEYRRWAKMVKKSYHTQTATN